MDHKQLQSTIDRCIKNVWLNNISKDYQSFFLLKEDTLKNALYYHIRSALDTIFNEHHLRIYTEFHYKGYIADIAVVKLKENAGTSEHLRDDIESVLTIIEVKYKNGGSTTPFESDIEKIKQYLEMKPLDQCQFYLAFIHEAVYDFANERSWLTKEQKEWASRRVTELSGYYEDNFSNMVWEVISTDGIERKIPTSTKIDRHFIEANAAKFNEKKYNHEFYTYFLNLIENAATVNDELEKAVEHMFYWKLGKVSSKPTATSKRVTLANKSHYFINGTTRANKQSIENATKTELLELGLRFRDGLVSYDELKHSVNRITQTTSSIVLPSFFIHLLKPAEYPILDVKVWRTYLWANDQPICKHTKPRSWDHYEKYQDFFHRMEEQTQLSWRIVDKGLWVIGEELKI